MTSRVALGVVSALVVGSIVAFGAACGGGKQRPMTMEEMIKADPLPLAKGARWTYDVTVKRYDADTDKVQTKTLAWTTEVVGAQSGNGIIAYRIKGWPTDLADFDQSPVATEKTLIRAGNSFMWLRSDPGVATTGTPDLDDAEGWFTWPVIDGQKICPSQAVVYCWQVASAPTGFALSFVTGPDEETFEIQPNTGVSRFHYAHHGTTNEVDAKLVSFSSGR